MLIAIALSFLVILISSYSFLIYSSLYLVLINSIIAISFSFVIYLRYVVHEKEKNLFMNMASFIELMILNINVQNTIDGAFNVVKTLIDEKLLKKFSKVNQANAREAVTELSSHFSHHFYDIFIGLIFTYEERGGDIIKMSEVLLLRIDSTRAIVNTLQKIDFRYVIKFMSNWFFIFSVSLVFRFALNNIFNEMSKSISFIIGNEILITTMLVSLFFVLENKRKRTLNVS